MNLKLIGSVIVIVLFIAGAVGWVKNIVKLTDCDFAAPYKCEIVHIAGLVPPIGAFVGYMETGQ